MPKNDRWTPARKRAAQAFERYIRCFRSYSKDQRQTAESAFQCGFRSGVIFVEQRYRDLIKSSEVQK